MGDAFCYRLRADEAERDRGLLFGVYENLVAVRPTWVTAETFESLDGRSMIFLITTERRDRLEELDGLSSYRAGLAQRCETEPRDYLIRRSTIDHFPFERIAYWNPYRRTWAFPPYARRGDRLEAMSRPTRPR